MTRLPFSLRRTLLIARNTVEEARRQKLVSVFVLLALGLVVGVRYLRDFNFGSPELKFIADFGEGAMSLFGAALTVVATTQLFLSEIENRTALTLLAKPVWRLEFVLGKFAGVAAVTAGFCATLSAALLVVLWSRESELLQEFPDARARGATFSLGALLVSGWLQWLKLAMLSAGTLLIATFARTQLYAVMTGFALFAICHLRNGSAIGALFPDFQIFTTDLGTNMPPMHLARLTVYALGHVAVALALATYVFRKREI